MPETITQTTSSAHEQKQPVHMAPQQEQVQPVLQQPILVREQPATPTEEQDTPITQQVLTQQDKIILSQQDRQLLEATQASILADLERPQQEDVFTTRLQEAPTGWAANSVLGKSARKAAAETIERRSQTLYTQRHIRNYPLNTGQDWATKVFFQSENRYLGTIRTGKLRQEGIDLHQLYERVDPIGYEWRSRCQKYAKLKQTDVTAEHRAMAERDVRNLVDNYRLDLFLEKKTEFPPEVTRPLDYYQAIFRNGDFHTVFESLFHSSYMINAMTEYCANHNLSEEQQRELKNSFKEKFRKNGDKFLLYPKSMAQNFTPDVLSKSHVLRANILALQTVKKMAAGTYRDMMIALLEDRVNLAFAAKQQSIAALTASLNANDPAYDTALFKAMEDITALRNMELQTRGKTLAGVGGRQEFLKQYYHHAFQFCAYNLGDEATALIEIAERAVQMREQDQNATK